FPGRRTCRREAEEGRKLLSILKSPSGQSSDIIHFRQLLCPDPLCGVCNRTSAKVSQLICKASLEDLANSVSHVPSITSAKESSVFLSAAVSAIPSGASISAPLSEPTPPPSSEVSSDQATSLTEQVLPSSLSGDSLPPESVPPLSTDLPVDHIPTQPPMPIPPPLSTDLPVDHIPTQPPMPIPAPLSTDLPVDHFPTQPPMPIPPSLSSEHPVDHFPPQPPVPIPPSLSSEHLVDHFPPQPPVPIPPPLHDSQEIQSDLQPETTLSLADRPDGLSTDVPMTRSTDSASLEKQSHAENLSPSKLEHTDDHENLIDLHSSEPSFESDTTANLVESGNISFLSPDVLALLERQIKKKGDFLMQKEKKKKKSFPKELKPDYKLHSSEKMLKSVADQQDSPVSLPLQSSKDKSEELQGQHQIPYPKSSEGHLQQKYTQFFWGLPSLHSESLNPKVFVSGDSSTYVYFNKMSNSTTVDESPVLPHSPPLSLPEIQSQPLTQTPSQSQHTPPPLPSQDQLQSSAPILSPLPSSQVQSCGVCFHRFQDEAQSLLPSEIHDLEYNVLQKEQENLWGLPSVVQKSKEQFCPPAPNLSLDRQSSKVYVSPSILLGDFPLKKELRKKLEHHLRKRLIQHRWGLPRRVHESLSSMNPQTAEVPEIAESKSSYGLSWISLFKGQSSKDLKLSQSRCSHERNSELLPLEERVKKVKSPEIGTKDYPLSDPKGAPDNSLYSDFKTDLKNQLNSLLGKKSRTSRDNSIHKQLTEALEVHLSKKFEEINESQMPGSVHRSWHSMEQLLSCSKKSPSQMKHSDLAPLVGEDNFLNTSQDISFLGSKKQKKLEDHIKLFHERMKCGLPHKVQESIDIFNMKGTPSWSSFHSEVPPSASLISGKDSNIGVSKPLKGGLNTFHGDKKGTTISAPTVDRPRPATSTVSKESKKTLRYSPSCTSHELTENIKATESDRQTLLPHIRSDINEESQKQSVIANKCSSKLPTRQAGARPKSWNKGMSPNNSTEKPQRKMIKNLEYFPTFNKSREIFKAKELCVVRSQSTNSLMTIEAESFSVIDVNMSKVEPTLSTERPPEGISAPKESESSDLKNQLLNELKFKMESRERGLASGFTPDLSLASDNLTSKTLLTHFQSASSGDKAASQVLQAHFENRGISIEQGQKPWIPTHVLCKCQDKNLALASKRECPLAPKTGEFGGGDAGLGTRQPRRRPHHTQDTTLKEVLGSKSSQALSLKGQPPPENIRNQIKHFFQWFCPSTKPKGQEGFLKKGSSSSSVKGQNLIKRRAAFTGNTEAQKIMTDIGKVLEEKLVGRHGVEKKPLSTLRMSGKIQHKAGPQVQAEPVQKHAFNLKTPCSKVPSAKSYSQEVGLIGQRYPTRNRWVMDRGRQPQKSVTVQDKLSCQRHYPPMPYKEPMLHPNTTYRCQVGQVPPATPTFAKGTVLGNLSLLFKRKMLLRNV
ncbi:Spermatogenesis-associated protein 31D1, partial [Sciurus carolinensis]|nr:Spermatogenesis-associated protein 31D1 [Sciurus carolinensis]